MRRRRSYRVCRCTPNGCVEHLEARLLRELVNREIHPIRCAANPRRKGQVALRLGDLCAEAGHPWWAIKVWRLGMDLISDRDYDDWIDVWFHTEWVRFSDVISEDLCLMLGQRIDNQWRSLGHAEMAFHEQLARSRYDWLVYEKFDYDRQAIDDEWDEIYREYEEERAREALFSVFIM